jgi:hypothetical protein
MGTQMQAVHSLIVSNVSTECSQTTATMTISSLLCKPSLLSLAHVVIPNKITRRFNMADPALKLTKDVREAISAINKEVVTEIISIISPFTIL